MTVELPRVGYGQAFASRGLRALVTGQLVSVTGTSVAAVALTILVYRRTESPFFSSLAFALGFLPYVLGGGVLSSVVDRIRPRPLVIGCGMAAAVLAAAMAIPSMPVAALFALLLAIGTLTSLSAGASATLVRASVLDEAYVPARSLLRIAAQVGQIGGNAAGGALLLVLTPTGALLANAFSFVVAAGLVRLFVEDHDGGGSPVRAPLLRDSLAGARAVFAVPELRRLLLAAWLVPLCSVAPEALAAPYVARHHGSPALVGWWLVMLPAGVIAGDLVAVRFLSPRLQQRAVAPVAAAGFLPYLAFATDPPIPVALALLGLSGASGFYALGLDASVRDACPPELFARTMTLNSAGLMTLQGLGFALAGAVAQWTSAALAITLAGSAGLAVVLALLSAPILTNPGRR